MLISNLEEFFERLMINKFILGYYNNKVIIKGQSHIPIQNAMRRTNLRTCYDIQECTVYSKIKLRFIYFSWTASLHLVIVTHISTAAWS